MVERIFTGGRWLEGPAYFAAGRYLVFSDIPNDRILRWDETTNQVGVFRSPANYTNGHTVDAQGRLVSCEQGSRRVTRTEHDGTITVLADNYRGKRLNSPNDVVVAADGAVWFTDPAYGIDSDYEGFRADQEQDGCYVFRVTPSGELTVVADDFARPNGLAFTPDRSQLLIVDSQRGHLRGFSVGDDGKLSGGDVVITDSADGIRFDNAGRLWTGTREGVYVYAPDLTLIGKLRLPEITANLCFGGPKRNQLFVTASTSVYTLRLTATGLPMR
ncbi:SMP-30/gluconolactonase/LRE family protein [Microlunatus elymi]|uniref:SMP-30/gluconolactonase/LRE family protein n=2 Tax=Microlunatus elymi TaxID=2596828 RepID=A0A516Q530_9ACTN|nr:SMP-30/gluconolactonase/LRE family protein [Microlunatus elymi]